MATLSAQVQQLVTAVQGYEQNTETIRSQYEDRIQQLERELNELRSRQPNKDVSMLNKLTVQVDELQKENALLKKRMRPGTVAPAPSETQSLYSASRARPAIKRKEEEPAPVVEQEVQMAPEPEVVEPEPEPEQEEAELYLLDHLQSGQYFWEPESGELYEKLSDEDVGEVVGKIKTIQIRDKCYYQDTIDNSVYTYLDGGDIGERCGSIVNRKFVKA